MAIIDFQPSGKKVDVAAGASLAAACRQAGFAVPAPCGGKGLCGKCRVKVLKGDVPIDGGQEKCLPPALLAQGWRASCAARANSDLTLLDPDAADTGAVVLTDFLAREPRGRSGWWERGVNLPPPSSQDRRDDATRLAAALEQHSSSPTQGALRYDLAALADLPRILRHSGFQCRVAGFGDTVARVRPADPAASHAVLGLAADVGTTTLAVALCDLESGDILALAAGTNPQNAHGDDMVARMEYAAKGADELREMRILLVDALERLARDACGQAGADGEPLLLAVAANPVMNHLLLGVRTDALAVNPFVPAFHGPIWIRAERIGWRGENPPLAYIIPNIDGFVGGDIAAGLLAHDVHSLPGNTLFLDVGTNGEIVLACSGRLFACAAAAGPAFEGARITQGMRAASGAISRVALNRDGLPETGVIDSLRPARGLCGTGLLDAAAMLLHAGVIGSDGRILDPDTIRKNTPRVNPGLLSLLHREADASWAFWLERPSGRGGVGVKLTQKDVRELQLAKGAMAAGVRIVLAEAGIGPEALDRVLLAGGFGNYLDPDSAARVGLLPAGVDAGIIRSVGNASLAGARLCLLSGEERAEAERLSRSVRYIPLSGSERFNAVFAEEMLFRV